MTPSKPRRLSPQMRKVLETVSVYEEIIGRGTTAGVVSAGGGSPGVLYSAVKKGWVLPYLDSNNDDGDRAPHYWRTNEGTRVLNEDTELYGPHQPPEAERDGVDPDVVDELYRLAEEAEYVLAAGENLRAAEVFDRARMLAESAGTPEETVAYFVGRAKVARAGYVAIPGLGRWIRERPETVPQRKSSPLLTEYGFPYGRYLVDGVRYWFKWNPRRSSADIQRYDDTKKPKAGWSGMVGKAEADGVIAAIQSDAYKQAVGYGTLTGFCGLCGTRLTKQESLKLGMGPHCARKAFPDEWTETDTEGDGQ